MAVDIVSVRRTIRVNDVPERGHLHVITVFRFPAVARADECGDVPVWLLGDVTDRRAQEGAVPHDRPGAVEDDRITAVAARDACCRKLPRGYAGERAQLNVANVAGKLRGLSG